MKNTKFLIFFLLGGLFYACKETPKKDADSIKKTEKEQRIVSLNGAVTEIVSALGHEKEIVARDVTSTYPDYVRDSVRDLGHVSSISFEAVIQQNPDLIIASEADMDEDLLQNIRGSGIDYHLFKQDYSIEGTKRLIEEVAGFIESKNAKALEDKIDADLSGLKKFDTRPKILFIYARGAGTLMVSGEGTPMHNIIEIAGGSNAVKEFKGFKPLTTEALISANPDIILLFDSGLASMEGKKGLFKNIPALKETNAGKNEAVISMDGGLMSGFGPRVGEAAKELNHLIENYVEQ